MPLLSSVLYVLLKIQVQFGFRRSNNKCYNQKML